MDFSIKYRLSLAVIVSLLFISFQSKAQSDSIGKKWGPNDTLIVPAIIYEGESLPYKEMEMVWVSNMPPDKLAKYIEEWNRFMLLIHMQELQVLQ